MCRIGVGDHSTPEAASPRRFCINLIASDFFKDIKGCFKVTNITLLPIRCSIDKAVFGIDRKMVHLSKPLNLVVCSAGKWESYPGRLPKKNIPHLLSKGGKVKFVNTTIFIGLK